LRSLGRGRRRSWSLLIGAEVAAATTLLVGAGLLIRSVFEIRGAELGWDPTDLIVAEVALPPSRYPDASSRVRWTEELRAELKSIPGVRSVGTTTRLPLEPTKDAAPVYTPEGGFASSAYAGFRIVDSGYFDALSIALLEGRTFTDADASGAPDVAVVSESLARKLWPDGGAIGQRLRSNNDFGWSRDDEWLTVVGVVANVRHWRMAAGTQHEIYVPFQQRGERTATMSWVVRHNGRMGDVAPVVRDRIGDMDADVPITLLGMDDQLIATYRDRRFTLALLGLFGGTVTMLALIGIVGVVSYAVERRRREIGIRLALGARTLSVRRGLQAESLLPALVGAAVGLVAALALTRAVAGLLYEVRPVDPATYLVVPVFLLGATWLASLVPARRALRVDPARVLRGD
jgi:predicted permease